MILLPRNGFNPHLMYSDLGMDEPTQGQGRRVLAGLLLLVFLAMLIRFVSGELAPRVMRGGMLRTVGVRFMRGRWAGW